MNKLASIQKIHSIVPHPNPEVERLEVGKIMEWPVVIPKGQYHENELVIFIEIDSIVPKENPYFSFMERQKYRIWNARFKGASSSGLVCPISILSKDKIYSDGMDITLELGVTKYERPLDFTACGDAVGGFPTNLISISDEDNMLSNSSALEELEGKEVYISQKADGSSTTFIFNNAEFKACSRRLEVKEGTGFPWMGVTKYDIKNKLISLNRNIAIQAEAIGPKLNGNSMELKELELKVFRIKDLDTKQILGLNDLQSICNQLGLPTVDIIDAFKFNKEMHTVEYFRKLADSQKWKSNGKDGEGIVIAPVKPFYSYILNKYWSLKIINNSYKQS